MPARHAGRRSDWWMHNFLATSWPFHLVPINLANLTCARGQLGLSNPLSMSTLSPTTQSSPASLPPSVFTLPRTAQLEALYTIIRDKNTSRGDFIFYTDRIIRILVEEGLNHLPVVPKTVETPTGSIYKGVGFEGRICGVSILRAGEVGSSSK
jgi:Uracil phosphoribosyltransferase